MGAGRAGLRHPSQRVSQSALILHRVSTGDAPRSSTLPDFDAHVVVDLDVRDDVRAGEPPWTRILTQTAVLAPGYVLHVRMVCSSEALLAQLHARGFASHSQPFAVDDWSIYVWWTDTPPAQRGTGGDADGAADGNADGQQHGEPSGEPGAEAAYDEATTLDLRGLSPPEPLRRILQRVQTDHGPFDVVLPFDPEPLHALLEREGWRATLVDRGAQWVRLRITQDA